MEKEANKYFLQLLNVYINLPINDHSFILAAMIGKFKKASVDLQRVLPSKCKVVEIAVQELIQYPKKDTLFLPQEIWNVLSNDTFTSFQNVPISLTSSKVEVGQGHYEIDDYEIINHNDDEKQQRSDMTIQDDHPNDKESYPNDKESYPILSLIRSNGINFKYMTIYAVGNGRNLSVGAPYSR